MFTLNELAMASDVDLRKIDPYGSDFDQRVSMANQSVDKWMKDPENRRYLNDKKADYIHDKGWSKGSNLKHEVDVPSEAFMLLPKEIRNDKKELMKWINKYHPQLMHRRIV